MTANPKSTLGKGKSHKCFKISDEYCRLALIGLRTTGPRTIHDFLSFDICRSLIPRKKKKRKDHTKTRAR